MVEEPKIEYKAPEKISPPPKIEYFGGYKNRVCLLVNYSDDRWIIPKDKIVLERILSAIKFDWNDIALLNVNEIKDLNLQEIINQMNPAYVISFGISRLDLSGFAKDQPEKYENCKMLIVSDSITDLSMSKERKAVLWKNLQEMFEIK